MLEADNNRTYFINRARALLHIVQSDECTPFADYSERVIKSTKGGVETASSVEVVEEGLLDTWTLKRLKRRAIFSLRNDLEKIGKLQTANSIIAKKTG